MLNEHAVVGAAAQVADRNVTVAASVGSANLVHVHRLALGLLLFFLPDVVHRAALGTWNLLGHVAHESFQTGHSRGIEVRPASRDIKIEISNRIGGSPPFSSFAT